MFLIKEKVGLSLDTSLIDSCKVFLKTLWVWEFINKYSRQRKYILLNYILESQYLEKIDIFSYISYYSFVAFVKKFKQETANGFLLAEKLLTTGRYFPA